MFKRSIAVTPLTDEAANNYFEKIRGEAYGSDTTFLASLRALISPRKPEEDEVYLKISRSNYTASNLSGYGKDSAIDLICQGMDYSDGTVNVVNICPREDDDVKYHFELLKANFVGHFDGGEWEILDKIEIFYKKSFGALCFISPSTKRVVLFIERLTLQKWHYLQMSTLAFMPWYFDPKAGMTELEFELVQSMRETDSAHYEECIKKLSKLYDFESGRIKKMLAGFETKYEKLELDRITKDIAAIDRNIENLNNQFANYNKQRMDHCIRKLGLEQRIADGEGSSEIMDYFLCNRKLHLVSVSGTTVKFTVKTTMDYFDEEMAKKFIGNKNSYMYSGCNSSFTVENMRKLLTAIFIDQKLTINTCAYFEFSIGGSIYAPDRHGFRGENCEEYMPNPHMWFHSCLGNYKVAINNRLVKHDYIGAIEQCVASTKSFNFSDSAVASKFSRELISGDNVNNRCIVLPDGTVVNAKEAVKWLIEQEKAKESDNTPASTQEDVATRVEAAPEMPF